MKFWGKFLRFFAVALVFGGLLGVIPGVIPLANVASAANPYISDFHWYYNSNFQLFVSFHTENNLPTGLKLRVLYGGAVPAGTSAAALEDYAVSAVRLTNGNLQINGRRTSCNGGDCAAPVELISNTDYVLPVEFLTKPDGFFLLPNNGVSRPITRDNVISFLGRDFSADDFAYLAIFGESNNFLAGDISPHYFEPWQGVLLKTNKITVPTNSFSLKAFYGNAPGNYDRIRFLFADAISGAATTSDFLIASSYQTDSFLVSLPNGSYSVQAELINSSSGAHSELSAPVSISVNSSAGERLSLANPYISNFKWFYDENNLLSFSFHAEQSGANVYAILNQNPLDSLDTIIADGTSYIFGNPNPVRFDNGGERILNGSRVGPDTFRPVPLVAGQDYTFHVEILRQPNGDFFYKPSLPGAFSNPINQDDMKSYLGIDLAATDFLNLVFLDSSRNFLWVDNSRYHFTSNAKNPVIIVPGIMGSQLFNENDLVWPDILQMFTDINDQFLPNNLALGTDGSSLTSTIRLGKVIDSLSLNVPLVGEVEVLNTFRDLETDLNSAGYSKDSTYFFFPYDWRLNLDNTKVLLNQKIEQVKAQTGASKVDIIAHSMGGLLVEDYIDQYGESSIDKLIFIGTPHLGSPKSARTLLEGDNLGIPWLDNDAVKDVAHNSPAVYELLPNQTYVNNLSGYIKPWSLFGSNPYTYNETKDFLLGQGMNATVFGQAESFFSKNLQNTDFSGIDTYNIAGCNMGTESLYQLHVLNNGIGLIGYSSGDGTVPLGSADFVNLPVGKKYYAKNVDHSSLPSAQDVRMGIVDILSDSVVATSSNFRADTSLCGLSGKILTWHSPVEVHVYDAQNHHTGPIENNAIEYGIPGVQYQILGHNKFIFLPTDTGENYHIEARGTASGTFDLLIAENNDGMIVDTNVFNDIPVTTSTTVVFSVSGTTPDNAISTQNGSSAPTIVPATSLLLGSQGEDVVAPVTTASTSGSAGTNGWYKSDVKVVLSATDDNSGILETRYYLNDGLTFSPYTAPVTITQEGTTTIRYFSIDKAGNDEEIKTLNIKVDRTPPELSAYFDTSNKIYKFEATDNLTTGLVASCMTVKCTATDAAGNTTILTYEKSVILNRNILTLKSISYNGVVAKLPENILIVNFDSKNGVIKLFNQTLLVRIF